MKAGTPNVVTGVKDGFERKLEGEFIVVPAGVFESSNLKFPLDDPEARDGDLPLGNCP